MSRDAPAEDLAIPLKGRLLLVGDVMLDIYTYGDCARISPEAPIPILSVTRETQMLGGIGNVARNVAALGGRAIIVAPIGCDADGRTLERLLAVEGAVENRLLPLPHRRTTVKQRFVANLQQMLRIDREVTVPLDGEEEAALLDRALPALAAADAVILSDYGKGTLTPRVIAAVATAAAAAGKPIFVDPKHRDPARYAGTTCITPNARELSDATGLATRTDAEVVEAARAMLAGSGAAYVLATRSADGMSLVPREGAAVHLAARRRQVFDVSGAGDTVIGTLALAVASGIDWAAAAGLANVAAGVVVGKPGTATCTIEDLELELAFSSAAAGSKLASARQAARLAAQWRQQGLRVGFTNGCFDLLHPGHVTLLRRAREACDRLIVGLNSDESVRRLKGPTRPLQSEVSRAAVLAGLAAVDLLVVFAEDTPLELIEAVRPTVLLKGADYTVETVVGAELVLAYGGEVKLVDLVEGQSTTAIIARMA